MPPFFTPEPRCFPTPNHLFHHPRLEFSGHASYIVGMTNFNPLNEMTFMNSLPLLRNSFLALSLSAFLIPEAYAAADNNNDQAIGQVARLASMFENNSLASIHDAQSGGHVTDITRVSPPEDQNITHALPHEMLSHVFSQLSLKDILATKGTCTLFYNAFHNAFSDETSTEKFKVGVFLYHLRKTDQISLRGNGILSSPLTEARLGPDVFKEGLTHLSFPTYKYDLPEKPFDGLGNVTELYFTNTRCHFSQDNFFGLNTLDLLSIKQHKGSLHRKNKHTTFGPNTFTLLGALNLLIISQMNRTIPEAERNALEARGVTLR